MVTKKPRFRNLDKKKEFDNLGVCMKIVLNKALKGNRGMRIRSIIIN